MYELFSLNGSPLPLEQWPIRRLVRGEKVRDYELILRREESEWERIFSYSGTVGRDPGGVVAMGLLTVRDITNLKKAEEALIRTEKLASVGRMAATISHEINNPLESVMNSVYLASTDPGISDETRANLELAEQELERASHIARQTLGFYKEVGPPRAVPLTPVLKGVLDLHAPKLKTKNVAVDERYSANVSIVGIPGEIRQILSNLVSNAVDAMETGGELRVRTSFYRSGSMVRITLADTGGGIDPKHMEKIFEPFFTTKVSIGTGLGLWVSKQMVEKHGGFMRVRSRVGHGAVFSLFFPIAEQGRDNTRL